MSTPQDKGSPQSGERVARGLFLRGLFQDRLPGDRHFRAPVASRVLWWQKTLRLALAGWYFLGLALAGWILFTFFQNYQAFRVAGPAPIPASGSATPAHQDLTELQQQIQQVEKKNRSLVVSRFGFDQSLELEKTLKQTYSRQFAQLIEKTEQSLLELQGRPDSHLDAEHRQLLVRFLAGQSLLVEESLAGKELSLDRYQELTKGWWRQTELAPSADTIGNLYQSRIIWSEDERLWSRKRSEYLALLKSILLDSSRDPAWLWSPPAISALSVDLNDLWVRLPRDLGAGVNGVFTESGRVQVQSFLTPLIQLFPEDDPQLVGFQKLFWNSYWQAFFAAWENFTQRFLTHCEQLALQPGNLPLGQEITRQDGPHWRLLEQMSNEMEGLSNEISRPAWVRQLLRLAISRGIYLSKTESETGGLSGKLEAMKDALGRKGATMVGAKPDIDSTRQGQLVELWKAYLADLLALSPASVRPEQRIAQFGAFFQGGGQVAPSAFQTGFDNSRKLTNLSQDDGDTLATRLIHSPLDFMFRLSAVEAAEHLQQMWAADVLAPLVNSDTPGQLSVLFGQPDGLVNKYLAEYAGPYLRRDEQGYYPRAALGLSFPFRQEFLRFLGSGSVSNRDFDKKYPVDLATLPLEVNPESKARPYVGRLEMQCANEKTVLENWNYPDQKQFIWSPANCGMFRLTIDFADETQLQREYPGALGFPGFLRDMRDGRQTLALEAFQGDRIRLAAQGLKTITIALRMSGESPVIAWLKQVPLQIPQKLIGEFVPPEPAPAVSPTETQSLPGNERQVDAAPTHTVTAVEEDKPSVSTGVLPQQTHSAATDQGDWARHQPEENWTLKLMSLKSEAMLREVLAKTKTPYPLHWFAKSDSRGTWYVIISGSFATRGEAESARGLLPKTLREGSFSVPFNKLQLTGGSE